MELDRVRVFTVQVADPGLLQLLEVTEGVGEHDVVHLQSLRLEVERALHYIIEVALSVVALRELTGEYVDQGFEVLIS